VLQSQASWTKADPVDIDCKRRFRWPTVADYAFDAASIGRDELLSFDERLDGGDVAITVE
jgi:hypothetical protein